MCVQEWKSSKAARVVVCVCVCVSLPWRRQVVVWSGGCCWLHGSVPCHLCIDYSWAGSLRVPEGASSAANGPETEQEKSGEGGRIERGLCKFFQLDSLRFVNVQPKETNTAAGTDKITDIFKRLELFKAVWQNKSSFFPPVQVFLCTHSQAALMWLNKHTRACG